MSEIEIRICSAWSDCLQCEELQMRVWEMPDYRDVVPAHLLITAVKNGGILVGAFDGLEMVGFAFGFIGREGNDLKHRLKHTSHMLAVLPSVRTRGLGARMKWLQREQALKQGLDLMTWTYDPLQAVNGYLNLVRLGAIARRYYRNAYGEMTDALNAGMASDRFEVEWHLLSPRAIRRTAHWETVKSSKRRQDIYEIRWNVRGLPLIAKEHPLQGETLRIEFPTDINALKLSDPSLAVEWRTRTRETFERAFAAGYVACDVSRKLGPGERARCWYVLKTESDLEDAFNPLAPHSIYVRE